VLKGTTWSDDEEDEEDDDDQIVNNDQAIREEASRSLKAWKKYNVDWRALFPDLDRKRKQAGDEEGDEPLDLVEDLMCIGRRIGCPVSVPDVHVFFKKYFLSFSMHSLRGTR